MIGPAQLRDRPSHDQTGGVRVLSDGVPNLHPRIFPSGLIGGTPLKARATPHLTLAWNHSAATALEVSTGSKLRP
jgi:hypothetical protein